MRLVTVWPNEVGGQRSAVGVHTEECTALDYGRPAPSGIKFLSEAASISAPKLKWRAGLWYYGGRARTFSGYGHVNSSPPGMNLMIDSIDLLGGFFLEAAAGFFFRFLNNPFPYVRRHITVNKMC